jgi:hypothetical protein
MLLIGPLVHWQDRFAIQALRNPAEEGKLIIRRVDAGEHNLKISSP